MDYKGLLMQLTEGGIPCYTHMHQMPISGSKSSHMEITSNRMCGNGCMYLKFRWGKHQYLWAGHFHLWVAASAASGRWEDIMSGEKPHVWGIFKHDMLCVPLLKLRINSLKATVLISLWRAQRKTDSKQKTGGQGWLVSPIMGDSMKLQVLVWGTYDWSTPAERPASFTPPNT